MPHGKLLIDFVDAAMGRAGDLAALRDQLADATSPEHVVDAAAVVSNFCMMTRIADGTGTPLDAGTAAMSGDLRSALELDAYTSARVEAGGPTT